MDIQRQALVPYSADQMYRLVHAVASYPEFLSWCERSEVHEEHEDLQVASLVVSLGGIQQSFTTRNTLEPGERLRMQLIDGPFRSLAGEWTFRSLGESGSKVSLSLRFEMSRSLVAAPFRRGFTHVADRMVRDFCERAERVYGSGA